MLESQMQAPSDLDNRLRYLEQKVAMLQGQIQALRDGIQRVERQIALIVPRGS